MRNFRYPKLSSKPTTIFIAVKCTKIYRFERHIQIHPTIKPLDPDYEINTDVDPIPMDRRRTTLIKISVMKVPMQWLEHSRKFDRNLKKQFQ